ncbi:MAG: hypothetical protein Kow00127_22430 [Bacteroidales bacterium]
MSGLLLLALIVFQFYSEAQDLSGISKNPTSAHGNLNSTAVVYNASGIEQRKAPFTYILSGDLDVSLKGIHLPFSFVYSDRNKDFRQPFNQFGVSPHYKWLTVHLGYRNLRYSEFVLGGHTVFGAGLEMNPGLFRFGVIYGRLKRQTNYAVKIDNPLQDTSNTFKRKMLAFKIGVGNDNTYVDLVVLKASDDSTSAGYIREASSEFPAENLAAGLTTRIKLAPQLHFEGEGSGSVYTSNTGSVIPVTDEFPLITVNGSTNLFLAFRGSMIYRSKKGLRLSLNYRRIDPGYKTMGIYFINNDVENITFSTAFRLLKKRMSVNGSIGKERNNLKSERNATTGKTIGSLNISYDPVRYFGILFTYSNYTINQSPGRVQISDSIKLYQTNRTLVLAPHFQFSSKNGNLIHSINFSYSRMGLRDLNPNTSNFSDFTTDNLILMYNLGLTRQRLNLLLGLNSNKVLMALGTSRNNGFTAGVSQNYLQNRLNASFNINFTKSDNSVQQSLVVTPSLSGSYRAGRHHNFKLRLYLISNRSNDSEIDPILEETGDFSYVFTF